MRNRTVVHGFKLPVARMRKYPLCLALRHGLRHREGAGKENIECLRVVVVEVCDFSNGNALVAVAKTKEMAAQSLHLVSIECGNLLGGQHLINGCQYRRQEWSCAAH